MASTSSRSVTSPKPRNRSTSRAVRGSGVDRDSRDQAARDSSTKGVLSAREGSSLGSGDGKGTDLILHPQHLVNQNRAPSRLVPAHRATTVVPRDREWPASEFPPDPNIGCRANGLSHAARFRSEEHTSELQSRGHLVCRLLLEKKKNEANSIETNTNCPTRVQGR